MQRLLNRAGKHLVWTGLVVSLAGGCTGNAVEPAGQVTREERVEEVIWIDGLPEDKLMPGEEDEVARYYVETGIVEVVEGYGEEVVASLEGEQLLQPYLQFVYIPNWWWWWRSSGQPICQSEYYSVYKNSACDGKYYYGYSFINNDYDSGNSTVGTRDSYMTCSYCAGCGYCVARRNVVVGNYTVYDQLYGNGLPISTGDYHAQEACYVGPF